MGLKDLVDNLWFDWFTPVGHRKVKCSGIPGQFYCYESPFPGDIFLNIDILLLSDFTKKL